MHIGFSTLLLMTSRSKFVKCRFYPNSITQPFFDRRRIKTYSGFCKMDVMPFKGQEDQFEGVTVDSSIEYCSAEEFPLKLEKSILEWGDSNKRGIWFKVALEHSSWVPILAKNGFDYHHARNGSVVMYKWLPKDEDCNIPSYAHTMVGVGAVVINEASKILVVREKYWKTPHWKLPGGYVEPGENIVDAAIREVYEETKIRTEFHSLLNIRHAHKATFGCSDMYIVVSLKPLNNDIQKCDREIVAAEWLDISEYLNTPNVHELNRFFLQCFLNNQKNNTKIDCKHGIHRLFKKPYTVYYSTNEVPNDFDKLTLQDNK